MKALMDTPSEPRRSRAEEARFRCRALAARRIAQESEIARSATVSPAGELMIDEKKEVLELFRKVSSGSCNRCLYRALPKFEDRSMTGESPLPAAANLYRKSPRGSMEVRDANK